MTKKSSPTSAHPNPTASAGKIQPIGIPDILFLSSFVPTKKYQKPFINALIQSIRSNTMSSFLAVRALCLGILSLILLSAFPLRNVAIAKMYPPIPKMATTSPAIVFALVSHSIIAIIFLRMFATLSNTYVHGELSGYPHRIRCFL